MSWAFLIVQMTGTIGKVTWQIGECPFLEALPCLIANEWNWTRFVDRDMIMRYHWGAGVGHLYMHSNQGSKPTTSSKQRGGSHTGAHSQLPADHCGTDTEDEGNIGRSGIEGAPNLPRDSSTPKAPRPDEDGIADVDIEGEPPTGGLDQWGESDDEDSASEPDGFSDEDLNSEEEGMDDTYGLGDDSNSGGVFSYD